MHIVFTEIDCENSQKIGGRGNQHDYWILPRPPRHLSHYQTSTAFQSVTVSDGVAAFLIDTFI